MKILTLTATFPSIADPNWGVFVKERMKAVQALGVDVRVLAPLPYFPSVPLFKRWHHFSQFPREEVFEGLSVMRPRYFLPPKIGGYFHPQLMMGCARRAIQQIQRVYDFDMIDSHWLYPAGVVATQLGKELGKPVVITSRGADAMVFPDIRLKRTHIVRAVREADHLIGVSRQIADKMIELGADDEKVSVIANGVDCHKFRPLDREDARRSLGFAASDKLVLAVGDLLELKGYHLLIEALPKVLSVHPQAKVVICGGPGRHGRDFTKEITATVERLDLGEQVRLVGRQPHSELIKWYNASDVFTICSSREGSPNVLMEALACGLPAIGTQVGGIPDVLGDARLGMLIPERSPAAISQTVLRALDHSWDRVGIRKVMESHSWETTAKKVIHLAESVTDSYVV